MSHMTELRCLSMGDMVDADYFRMFSSCPENGFVRLSMRCRPTTGGLNRNGPSSGGKWGRDLVPSGLACRHRSLTADSGNGSKLQPGFMAGSPLNSPDVARRVPKVP